MKLLVSIKMQSSPARLQDDVNFKSKRKLLLLFSRRANSIELQFAINLLAMKLFNYTIEKSIVGFDICCVHLGVRGNCGVE